MNSVKILTTILFLTLIPGDYSQSLIQIKPENHHYSDDFHIFSGNRKIRLNDDASYCESWKFSVETNDAGVWTTVPERCASYVTDYMHGDRYRSDSEVVAADSIKFARTVEVVGDGKDAWVFDIDETLLSRLPYYAVHGFGSKTIDKSSSDNWVEDDLPALPASLSLYKELQELGFTIFLLTGRHEFQRNVTMQNLETAGYTNFEKLILRRPVDEDKTAIVYKSESRNALRAGGYRIRGNSGDQWSDLMGYAVAERAFKLPNPMYYVI